ncbi:hypothetical protein Tco_1153001 [Tanacetum coccineum]
MVNREVQLQALVDKQKLALMGKQRKDTKIPQSSGPTEHIEDEVANEEHVPTQSNDPSLSRVNTLGSGEDRLSLKELMDLFYKIEDASNEGRKIDDIDADVEVTLINETRGRNDDYLMFDTCVLDEQEVDVEKEQEELTIEEKFKLFQQLLEKKRKHFAAKRVEERRSKPPTKAQQRNIMTTYLKNMVGWKPKDLKNKSFASIQELFENVLKRVNTFVDMDTELVEGNEIREKESGFKRIGDELEQEHTKKKKMDDDKERKDLQQCFELVTEEVVAINAIPLATKPAPIVNFQIHRKGRNGYYEIMRADGSSKTYLLFSQLLKEFDREDLENLWKLVKEKHRNTRLEEGYERVLWGDLKTMFEHHIEDEVWRSLQGKKVLL